MSELTAEEEDAFLKSPTTPAPGITVALAIPTTASWAPGRAEALEILKADLRLAEAPPPDLLIHDNKSDRHVWSMALWTWGASTTATHFLQVQDDMRVAPNFWAVLRAMIEALPTEVICLQSVHQAAAALCSEDVRFYTTSEGLLGPAYVLPMPVLREFLEWRENGLNSPAEGFPEGEDTLLGMFCMVTGRKIWSPVPTIVDHPDLAGSTYGNQGGARRRPLVRWDMAHAFDDAWWLEDLEAPGFWEGRFKRVKMLAPDLKTGIGHKRAYNLAPESPRHLGRFYENGIMPTLARQWVKGYGVKALARDRADNGARELRRLFYAIRGKGRLPTERILICTPVRGGTSPHYAVQLVAYQAMADTELQNGFELLDAWAWSDDVVRCRSRFLYKFLETDATRLFFLDSDNVASPLALRGMLQSGKELVACPYPRRDALDLNALEAYREHLPKGTPWEALVYKYSVGVPKEGLTPDATGCAKVHWFSLGCSLITRGVIEKMTGHFEGLDQGVDLARLGECHTRTQLNELVVDLIAEVQGWRNGHLGLTVVDQDPFTKQDHPMVALFQLLRRESPETGIVRLWGEDQSFCYRASDIGIQPWLYLGPGSPVSHDGTHMYKGHVEAFGFTRGPGAL